MSDQKSKILATLAIIFIGMGLLLIFQALSFGKLRIIACDVGQGDGLLIITPGGRQIVVDGGPGNKIVDCLGTKMPFWDRTLELVILTHPQRDHMEGLVEVLARYKVEMIATTGIKNESELFETWQKALNGEKAKIYQPKAGDKLRVDRVTLDILWPSFAKASEWQANLPSDLNETSIVLRVVRDKFCAYLTGDIPKEILQTVVDKPCQILKVAHHGSKTGTNSQILEQVRPAIAVIQVGKNNRFGHPHKEVVDFLNSKGIKILRNDESGTIEVDTDGKNMSIKFGR